MNLYVVTYQFINDTRLVKVVAATPLKAIEGAKVVMRQRYAGDREILTVVKEQSIDRVVR